MKNKILKWGLDVYAAYAVVSALGSYFTNDYKIVNLGKTPMHISTPVNNSLDFHHKVFGGIRTTYTVSPDTVTIPTSDDIAEWALSA